MVRHNKTQIKRKQVLRLGEYEEAGMESAGTVHHDVLVSQRLEFAREGGHVFACSSEVGVGLPTCIRRVNTRMFVSFRLS